MSRIRTVKPSFWSNGKILECSISARLLFIGLLNFCDDCGRHEFRPRQIRAQIFPGESFTDDDMLLMLDNLCNVGLISRYEVAGKEYLRVEGWHHQRIDKPQPPRCPEPETGFSSSAHSTIPEHSANSTGMSTEAAENTPSSFRPDRKGEEEKVKKNVQRADKFGDFWEIYPRKAKKADAARIWKRRGLDSISATIVDDVRRRSAEDSRWLSNFIPDPTTYLNGNRWEDEIHRAPPSTGSLPDWARIPAADDELWDWAKRHGYLNPGHRTYIQYRNALKEAVEQRKRNGC